MFFCSSYLFSFSLSCGRLAVVFFLSTYLFVVAAWNAYGRCTKDCVLVLGYGEWRSKAWGWSPHSDVHNYLWRGDRLAQEPAIKYHQKWGWSLCWQRRGWPGSGFIKKCYLNCNEIGLYIESLLWISLILWQHCDKSNKQAQSGLFLVHTFVLLNTYKISGYTKQAQSGLFLVRTFAFFGTQYKISGYTKKAQSSLVLGYTFGSGMHVNAVLICSVGFEWWLVSDICVPPVWR